MAPSRVLVLQDQEWLSVWGELLIRTRQVDAQPTKRFKNDDKSAVAMLKKGNWQEREPVTDECHVTIDRETWEEK